MIKPATKAKWLPHTIIWFLLFLFPCLHLSSYMHRYGPREWLQFAYLIPSSVVTFYAAFYFTQRYMDRYYLYLIHDKGFFKKVGWLMQWPTLVVLLVFGANLFSWQLLGNDFYELTGLRPQDGPSPFEKGHFRALAFTGAGAFYGYSKWILGEGDKELARLEREQAKLEKEFEKLMKKVDELPDEERAEFLKEFYKQGFRLDDKLGKDEAKN